MSEPPLHTDILRVLCAGPAEGLRVAELRAKLAGQPEPATVQSALGKLLEQGRVQRDHNWRWSVPASLRLTSPPAAASSGKQRRFALTALKAIPGPTFLPEVMDAGIPPRSADGSFQLDDSQLPVAHASPRARQIVEAGPGHGKTAVACARVAHLLDQGVPGTQILLLSFTRTAVREMRLRIQEMAAAGTDVVDIRILTIDSWSTRLRYGYLGTAATVGSFDDGIRQTLGLLRQPTADLAARLQEFQHVLIDEAQDLVGLRAQLIAQLLRVVSANCGFTVFLDPAQGIYDWAEEDTPEGEVPVKFAELLGSVPGVEPPVQLLHLHRTAEPRLRRLLLGARKLVLDPATPLPATSLRSILRQDMNDGWPDWKEIVPALPDDALVLFRRRGAVLDASAWLAGAGIPHRLRLGGLPQPVAPWVAILLHDVLDGNGGQPVLSFDEAERAWAALEGGYLTRGWAFDGAWRVLRRMAAEGRSRIDARKVADALLGGRVPDDLYTRELGPFGPVLGTIHGSKGREGSRVVFVVPAADDWRFDEDDHESGEREAIEASEARVLYVAITRAKERLDLYDGGRSYWGKANGRDWQRAKNNRIRFEVGREHDLDAARAMILTPGGAGRHQRWMRSFDGTSRPISAVRPGARRTTPWEIRDPNGCDRDGSGPMVISILNADADRDLYEALSKKGLKRTSDELRHLYQIDLTTTALHPEHPAADRLPDPWRTLRLILAPVVVGLGSTYARKR